MRTTLLEKYPHPTNFGECKAPILDLEIKRALDQLTLRRDKYQAYTQDKVGNTIAALGKSINKLLQSTKTSQGRYLDRPQQCSSHSNRGFLRNVQITPISDITDAISNS
jgi:hypothetical protein